MSQSVIFIVGAIIFVITVYGVVMAGGLLLTRRQVEHGDNVGWVPGRDGPDLADRVVVPTDGTGGV